jgi:hypothetical protein
MNVPLAAFALAAAAGAAPPPAPPPVKFDLASETVAVPMKIEDGRIVLDVRVNGKGPFPFLLDTGAHGGVIDLAFARAQGLTLGDELSIATPGGSGRPAWMTSIARLDVGGLALRDVPLVASDALPFPPTPDAPRGVLSPYGLSGLLIALDYPKGSVVFRRGALPEPDGREVFGWDRGKELPEIPVTIAGRKIAVHLDSGGAGGVMLPDAMAGEVPLAAPPIEVGRARGVDQDVPIRMAKLQGSMTIGRYTIDNPTLHFVGFYQTQGNLGPPVLKHFVLTLDPANARLRLEGPADGKLEVSEDRPRRYGVQFHGLDGSPLEVAGVDLGSPAAKAGLQPGDRIVSMNGRAIEEMTADDRLHALRASPLKLGIKRGDTKLETEMTLDPK